MEKQRTKAKRRGLEYTLTVDDYKTLKDADGCYYCKDPMELVTIDRIDNNVGYIIFNCCYTDPKFVFYIEFCFVNRRFYFR